MKYIYFVNNTDLLLPHWDGMTIIERFLSGESFIDDDGILLVDQRHNELVRFFI